MNLDNLEYTYDTLDDAFHHTELLMAVLDELNEEEKDELDDIIETADELLELLAKKLEVIDNMIANIHAAEDAQLIRDSYKW